MPSGVAEIYFYLSIYQFMRVLTTCPGLHSTAGGWDSNLQPIDRKSSTLQLCHRACRVGKNHAGLPWKREHILLLLLCLEWQKNPLATSFESLSHDNEKSNTILNIQELSVTHSFNVGWRLNQQWQNVDGNDIYRDRLLVDTIGHTMNFSTGSDW